MVTQIRPKLLIIHIESEYHYQDGNNTKGEEYISVLVLHYFVGLISILYRYISAFI